MIGPTPERLLTPEESDVMLRKSINLPLVRYLMGWQCTSHETQWAKDWLAAWRKRHSWTTTPAAARRHV